MTPLGPTAFAVLVWLLVLLVLAVLVYEAYALAADAGWV